MITWNSRGQVLPGFVLVLSMAVLCLVLQLELLRKIHAYFILRKIACGYARSLILGKPSIRAQFSYRYRLDVGQVRGFVLWKYQSLFTGAFMGFSKRSFEVSDSCLFPYGS